MHSPHIRFKLTHNFVTHNRLTSRPRAAKHSPQFACLATETQTVSQTNESNVHNNWICVCLHVLHIETDNNGKERGRERRRWVMRPHIYTVGFVRNCKSIQLHYGGGMDEDSHLRHTENTPTQRDYFDRLSASLSVTNIYIVEQRRIFALACTKERIPEITIRILRVVGGGVLFAKALRIARVGFYSRRILGWSRYGWTWRLYRGRTVGRRRICTFVRPRIYCAWFFFSRNILCVWIRTELPSRECIIMVFSAMRHDS